MWHRMTYKRLRNAMHKDVKSKVYFFNMVEGLFLIKLVSFYQLLIVLRILETEGSRRNHFHRI